MNRIATSRAFQRLSSKTRRTVLSLAFVTLFGGQNQAQVISTYAGANRLFTGDGQPATALFLSKVSSVTMDSSGNPVFAVRYRNVVLRVNPDGTIKRLAGNGNKGFTGDGLQATSATLNTPQGAAFDSNANLYIADTGNNVVRKVSALDGTISTFAGNGQAGFGGDNAQAAQATLQEPTAIVVDGFNNIYINDEGNRRIRKVNTQGIISTYAGGGNLPFQGTSLAMSISFLDPAAIALDAGANLYIADFAANRVVRVDAQTGMATNVAGTGAAGVPAEGSVAAVSPLYGPGGLAVDSAGDIYVSDTNSFKIRKISASGLITSVAGNGLAGFSGDGGPALQANLNATFGLALDKQSNLLLADRDNFRVRRVASAGQTISTVAGNGTSFDNGIPAANLLLFEPTGVSIAPDGSLYIADSASDVVRRVRMDGSSFTVAGTGGHGFSGDQGLATSAELSTPFGIGFDTLGNFYIADTDNNRIRKVDTNGVITTVAGNGTPGYNGDVIAAMEAELHQPTSVVFDGSGNMFIADFGNNRVRRVTNGVITTVAGAGTNIALNGPIGLAFDQNGDILIADAGNHRVLSLAPNGIAMPVAGGGSAPAAGGGGAATAATLGVVYGVGADIQGNVYFSDVSNNVVQKVSPSGLLSTIAGNGKAGYSGDGTTATLASLNLPIGLAVDPAGDVFIADDGNDRVRVVFAAPPKFQANPGSISFSAASAGLPVTQALTLSSAIAGLPYSLAVASGASWLTATPLAGQIPVTINVTADPGQLQPGTYDSTITVTSPTAAPPTQTISVHFTVGPAQPPRFAPLSQLSFAFSSRSAPESRTLQIGNAGGGTLTFTAAATTGNGSSWLQVSSPSGTATPSSSFSLTVTADPTGLGTGTYVGAVALTNTVGGNSVSVTVTLTVADMPQTMVLTQTGLTFTAVQGGGVVPSQTFEVVNKGQGTMNWTLTPTVTGGVSNWLAVSPSSGSSVGGAVPPPISVQVNPSGLTAGKYYGQIAVTSSTAANSPQLLTVVLNLLPSGQDPGPVIQPSGLIFAASAGGPNPAPQTITVSDLAAVPLTLGSSRTFVGVGNWFVHDPINATITPNSPLTITVTPLIAGLLPGVYQGALSLAFSDGYATSVVIRLIVAGPSTNSGKLGRVSSPACSPKVLVPVFTTLPNGFVAATGWPTSLAVKVLDDCGNPLTSGSVVVQFSNGDSALPLTSTLDGRWQGTWAAVNVSLASTTLTALAMTANPPPLLQGTISISGSVNQNPDPPIVNPGGVVNAASNRAPLAPGDLISIYGTQLSDATAAATSLPLETDLQDVEVSIGTTQLPLAYTSAGQINAILPYSVATNASNPLIVQRGGKRSTVMQVQIADALPAVFTPPGTQQGIIVDTNNQLVQPGNPAKAGDGAVIYCTGLGAVTGDVPAGAASPLSPLAMTTNSVSVSIGGQNATVLFSGLTPGFAGLYQVNILIPSGVSPSDSVPVVVSSGALSSATVTIAISN